MARRKVATWIRPKDRIAVELIKDVYKTKSGKRSNIGGWKYIKSSDRIAVYQKKDEYMVVLKGTTGISDVPDNLRLALGSESSVELIKEGSLLVQKLIDEGIDKTKITLTGHSLGGYAANSISKKNLIRSVTFNAAAPPTAPIISGAGNKYSTNYHIVGDVLSSHTSDDNALTIRANKNTNFFNTNWNHRLDRFYADDPTYSFWDATKENSLFNRDRLLFTGLTAGGNILTTSMKQIPGANPLVFQPFFQDKVPITKKEVNAAWVGRPLPNYTPTPNDQSPSGETIDEEVTRPTQEDYNALIKQRIMANSQAMKRAERQQLDYTKSLKSSLTLLKRPAPEPILWRARMTNNDTIQGRVILKPLRFDTISNKNV
jgi:hypothetical protein